MKVVIVMTYYDRLALLKNTLDSFTYTKATDFEVVIVDDASPSPIPALEYKFPIHIIRLARKLCPNTSPLHNMAFYHALCLGADIVLIQNAECYHWGDVISEALKVTEENYLAFGAYSLGKEEQPCNEVIKDRIVEFTGDSGWYNHSVYRPHGFHFCTAITIANLKKLNGFDERLYAGVAFEDNMFVHQIKNLGLRIDFIDRPMVFHQWHYNQGLSREELVLQNQNVWLELEKETGYRGVHTLTPDL